MSWNQVDETIAPNLQKAKDKAGDMVEGEEVAMISKDIKDKVTGQQWWTIKFYEYSNGPKVIVEESQ